MYINIYLTSFDFFGPPWTLLHAWQSGTAETRLGHMLEIGPSDLKSVRSVTIGPMSQNGKPLEWRSVPITRSLFCCLMESREQHNVPSSNVEILSLHMHLTPPPHSYFGSQSLASSDGTQTAVLTRYDRCPLPAQALI
jgi:hypothetical protein